MGDITMPNDFIPEKQDPFAGQGPMQAANGNIGGLQQALTNKSSPSPLNRLQQQDQMIQGLFSNMANRVRTPEQIAQEKEERKGGLAQLQAANLVPANNFTGFEHMLQGIVENDKPYDVSHGLAMGVSKAMQADLAKQALARQAGIENAQAAIGFGQKENQIASQADKDAMDNLTKIAAAQARAMAFKNGGFINVAGRGLVNLNEVDPVTGEQGRLIPGLESAKLADMTQRALDMARKQADAMGPGSFGSGPSAAQAKQEWITNKAKENMQAIGAGFGLPAAAINAIFEGNPVTSHGLPVYPASIQGNNQQQSASPQGLDTSKLTKDQIEYLKKQDPEAFANGVSDFNNTSLKDKIAQSNPVQPTIMPIGSPEAIKAGKTAAVKAMEGPYNAALDQETIGRNTLRVLKDADAFPPVETGPFAAWKQTAGNVLGELGINNKFVNQAADLGALDQILKQHVLNQIRQMGRGADTDAKAEAFDKAFVSIKDPQKQYQFALNHLREQAQQQIEASQAAKDTVTQAYKNNPNEEFAFSNVGKAIDDVSKNRGPNFVSAVDSETGGNTFFWRTEAIDKVVRDTLANHPKADPDEVRKAAEKAWRDNPKQFIPSVKK